MSERNSDTSKQTTAGVVLQEVPPLPSVGTRKYSINANGPRKAGIRLASVARVDDVLSDKLQQADSNNDGVLDAREVAAIIDEMVQEAKMKRVYRFISIGLFIVVAVLIGALTGITYGIVKLAQETKMTNYGDTNYQFMVMKDGTPAVTGGAKLTLDDFQFLPVGKRPNITHVVSNTRRRLQSADADFVLADPNYYGTITTTSVEAACNAITNGVNQLLVEKPVVIDGEEIPLFSMSTVTVTQQSGCTSGGSVSGTVSLDDGSTLLVDCGGGEFCTLIIGAAETTVLGGGVTNAGSDIIMFDRRRRHLASIDVSHYNTSIPEGCNVAVNATVGNKTMYCCSSCSEGYLRSNCSCTHCFPAAATVDVLGRGTVRMDELQYGDLVKSRDRATGKVVHRPVYLFGHREHERVVPYVHIYAGGRTLTMTPGHYAPVCVEGCTPEGLAQGSAKMEYRRAGEIRVGDVVLVAEPSHAFATVDEVEIATDRGAFNPYVRGADLIVDGVVASPHSEWLLDSVAPSWMVPHLPAVYEVMLAPVYLLYRFVGPVTAEWLAHDLGLAESGAESGEGYYKVLAGMAAPVLLAAVLGRAVSKRLVKGRR